jgi:hypothetical protein
MIAQGATLREASEKHQVTHERVRQIVMGFCRRHLEKANIYGTPEMFYPGPIHEQFNFYSAYLLKSTDPSVSEHNFHRLLKKELAIEDITTSYTTYRLDGLEELREYGDYWVHQIELLRAKRKQSAKGK